MGAKPAHPRDAPNQLGRDMHAIGDGLMKTVGRTGRQRVQPPRKRRGPNATASTSVGTILTADSGFSPGSDLVGGDSATTSTLDLPEGVWLLEASPGIGGVFALSDYRGWLEINATTAGSRSRVQVYVGVHTGVDDPLIITITGPDDVYANHFVDEATAWTTGSIFVGLKATCIADAAQ